MRALLLALALAALAAGCGGGDDDESERHDDDPEQRLRERRGSGPARPGDPGRAGGAPRREQELLARLRDELRLVHGRTRPRVGAEHDGVARRARRGRLLRRHDLPSRRAGIRDPGRRSHAVGRRAGPVTRQSTHHRPTRRTRKAPSRWRRPRREPPGASGSQFFVVTGEGATLTPDYAIVGEVTEGMDTVERIDALGVGEGPPSQPVVVDSVTVSTG